MKSSTQTLIEALRVLSQEIESGDGVANAAIAEAAERLQEQQESLDGLVQVVKSQKQTHDALIKQNRELLEALELAHEFLNSLPSGWLAKTTGDIGALNDFYLKSSAAIAKVKGGES